MRAVLLGVVLFLAATFGVADRRAGIDTPIDTKAVAVVPDRGDTANTANEEAVNLQRHRPEPHHLVGPRTNPVAFTSFKAHLPSNPSGAHRAFSQLRRTLLAPSPGAGATLERRTTPLLI